MPPETSVSQSAIYRARPTLRIGGEEDLRASELVIAMRMDESEGGMSRLELRFSNWASTTGGGAEAAFGPGSRLALGAEIAVYAGDEAAPREIFKGRVSALEAEYRTGAPPELNVLAEDALQSARMARRSRTYTDRSPADIARALAAEHGLTPVVSGLTAPVGSWAQLDESDLSFLRRLLARFDADLQVVGRELHVAPRSEVQRGALELQLHGQLGSARVSVDLADQVTSTRVRGWNARDGQAVDAEVSSGASLGPGSGRTGADWLGQAFEARLEHLSHITVPTVEEARAVAQAAFDQRARRFVRVDATAEGNPRLRVGSEVALSGLDPRFDNRYYVVRASHCYDVRQGYRTEFGAECAYLGGG